MVPFPCTVEQNNWLHKLLWNVDKLLFDKLESPNCVEDIKWLGGELHIGKRQIFD